MSFLPDIDDNGILIDKNPPVKLYTPPRTHGFKKEEEALAELNNIGRPQCNCCEEIHPGDGHQQHAHLFNCPLQL